MGVVNQKSKAKKELKKQEKEIANGKPKVGNEKVKKKKTVSCLQCIKPNKNDGGLEGKYRVAAPELMQDTFMSDSEDEGGEVECPIQQQQQYRYMNSEAGTLHRAKPLEDSVTDGHLWPSNNDKKVATIDRQPLDIGFLVSFVVDARGGAMKAKRRGGVRIIVPPAACAAPTRVTCRAATRRAPAAAPPPLMEGEALASRLLELQPQGAKFLAPVIIEVPIFTSSCREREIVILRSDTGETWQDHYLHNNDNPMIQEALQRERQDHGNTGETLGENGERVTRIVTCDFPHYLAVVSRVRQEVHIIGPEGGTVSSAHIPQVQALFPPQALTKRIRVGLQAHGAAPPQCRRVLPRHSAVSPVITVEPRRRKFHRSITLTAPLPQGQGGQHDKQSTSNLRLLCSIMGGQARAVWEDVTGSTPLTITDDCASFTTTVSARFWLMNCQNVSDATKLATELYRDMLLVPFEVRIVVLGKRLDALEGRLLVLYITDRYAYDTLLQQEHYTEVAHSTSVQFLDARPVYLEFSGNLVPVTKSGSQPCFTFEAFKDNRVEFTVRVKHHEESPSGRVYFMNEPKVPKGEQSQTPACVLDVELPDRIAPRAGKSQVDYLNLDQSGFDALNDELSFHWGGDHHHSIGPPPVPASGDHKQLNGHDKIITNGDVKYTDTKDTDDKTTKPQVNGDTLHVDSNKTKATFDSDEDKTPMNTLEKGKKKPEGFLGGLKDKVKNVFSSTDEDDKESSPKPQPKPRESKEKSPPKPAPRIINEDLLDKVDDMFKDLKTKPHQKEEEEIQKTVYTTKLFVDEDDKSLKEASEDLYEQYANMQPVETPLRNKVVDPFQFPKCCDGKKYKHTHDETSNVEDIIEQNKFAAHEKLGEATDKINSEFNDGLERIQEERESIKQKSVELKDDIVAAADRTSNDLKNKGEEVKSSVQIRIHEAETATDEKLDELLKATNKVQESVKAKASDVKANVVSGIEKIRSSTKDSVDLVGNTINVRKEDLKSKENEIDFAARERGEQLYLVGQNVEAAVKSKSNEVKEIAKDVGNDLKNKVQDGANTVVDSIHDVRDNLSNKAQDLKADVKETTEKVKDATNEKVNEVSESIENTKQKAKKEGKKKAKEGKNFFTGLVSNIFGEKEKIEEGVKGKISKGKEAANELAEEASAKKNELEQGVAKKQGELKKGAEDLAQSVKDEKKKVEEGLSQKQAELKQGAEQLAQNVKAEQKKVEEGLAQKQAELKHGAEELARNVKDEKKKVEEGLAQKHAEIKQDAEQLAQSVKDEKNKVEKAVSDKAHEISDVVHHKKEEAKKAFENKTQEIGDTIQNKKDEIASALQDKTTEAEKALQERKKLVVNFIETEKDAVLDKTNETKKAVLDKKDSIEGAIVNKKDEISSAISDKTSEAVKSVQDKTAEVESSIHSAKDKVAEVVKEKADTTKNALHDTKEQIGNFMQQKTEAIGKALHETKDALIEKKDDIVSAVHDETESVNNAINSKKDEVESSIVKKKDAVQSATQSEFDRIREEAELTTEQIKKSAEDAINAASNKKDQVKTAISDKAGDVKTYAEETLNSAADKTTEMKSNIVNKVDSVKVASKDHFDNAKKAAGDKLDDFQQSAKLTFGHVQESALGSFDKVESSAKDKLTEASDNWEDLQSSTRDTFAEMKEDSQSFGNSAQDTLRSFQSSAGNTFDSLDDSAREFIGGVESSSYKATDNAKELFGDVKSSFEGFQVTADNKLEDVKGLAEEKVEEVGGRLNEGYSEVQQGVRGAEAAAGDALAAEADKFTSSLNDLGNSVFGSSGKGFMKDSSTKLLESEKSQSSPSPHKKSSGIPKLKRKK